MCTLSKAPPPVWPHHQHTHVWICPGTTSIPVYRPKRTFDLKSNNLAMLAFKEKSTHTFTQNRAQFKKGQLTYLCHTTVWWYTTSRMALCLSSTLTNIQAHSGKLRTHNSQPAHSTSYKIFLVVFFSYFKCCQISSKFRPVTWKCCQTTTKGRRPHQRDTPSLLILVATMGKCKQANKFQSRHSWWSPFINYSWAESPD